MLSFGDVIRANLFVPMKENIDKFIDALRASLDHETFIKLTLGNYKGADKHLQKLSARLIETRKGRQLSLQYRYDTRNIVKNHTPEEAVDLVRGFLDGDFFSGHLFTTEGDYQLDISKKGKSRLHFLKPTFQTVLPTEHNRAKSLQIDPDRPYLHSLGITTDQGRVRDKQQDKWRQINKFVEIVSSLFDNSPLNDRKQLNIVDMGSGKGYLTFAVYDHFKNTRRLDIQVTGVEARRELVELCNRIAAENDFDGLSFVQGTIADFDVSEAHILIALHACDTATDDALHKGITSKASIIIAAPCCHKEIRPQIKPPEMFSGVLKHGVMLERTAETITDGLRALLLERSGYSTKLFEFVPVEHTPKNNMLAAVRNTKPVVTERADRQIREIKEFYGIEHQRLEDLVS
jgi:hypothetical protein